MEITLNIDYEEGLPLEQQSETFQIWFNGNIRSLIDFENSCVRRDEFYRPLEWVFADIKVQAIYFTIEEVPELTKNPSYRYNLNFKTFMIYGNI